MSDWPQDTANDYEGTPESDLDMLAAMLGRAHLPYVLEVPPAPCLQAVYVPTMCGLHVVALFTDAGDLLSLELVDLEEPDSS